MQEALVKTSIPCVIFMMLLAWWNDYEVLVIIGNVRPATSLIGQNVILSCQIKGCTSSNLKLYLYKWGHSRKNALYIYNSMKQHEVPESSTEESHKNGTHRGQYKDGLLEVTLFHVQTADTGQYVCAMTCSHVYKEVVMEVKVEGVINVTVGEDALLPCQVMETDEPSHLKLQWRRISPGKSQTLYSYLYQNTCPVYYSQCRLGDKCSFSIGPSIREQFGKKYKRKIEVFKGNDLRNWNGSLKLNNIQKYDAGKYECSVRYNSLQKVVTFNLSVTGDILVTGNVKPKIGLIGQDILLSCKVGGCKTSWLHMHLYKWEGFKNKTMYIHNGTKQHGVQESSAGGRHDGTYRGQYKDEVLEVMLHQVQRANSGQYVCAVTCAYVHKEVILEVTVEDVISTAVGRDALLPCQVMESGEPSHLKLEWRRINLRESQMIYVYMYQDTCPVVYSEDIQGDKCSCSNGPSIREWFGKKYKQKAEVFKGNILRNGNGSLKLSDISKEDAGKYKCSVRLNLLKKVTIFKLAVTETHNQNIEIWRFYYFARLYFLCIFLVIIYFVKNTEEQNDFAEELRELRHEMEVQNIAEELRKLSFEMEVQKKVAEDLKQLKCEMEWRRTHSNAANITLAVDSAHPNLSIADDKKSLTFESQPLSVSPNAQRFDGIVSVLGSQEFSSGQHYWEVDVGSSTDWDLGVVRESIQRKGDISMSPKEGFWLLGLNGKDYWARTDPWTKVTVGKKTNKIGVYLSFPEKEVTFFNCTDMSVLFVFKHCSFLENIYPFFKNTHKGTTIRISPIN